MGRWLFIIILTNKRQHIVWFPMKIREKRNDFLLLILVVVFERVHCVHTLEMLRQEIYELAHTWFVYAALIFSRVSILSHNNLLAIWFGVFLMERVTTRIHCHKFQTRDLACAHSAVFSFYHKHFGHNRRIGVDHSNTCIDANTQTNGWMYDESKIRLIEFRLDIFMPNIRKWM